MRRNSDDWVIGLVIVLVVFLTGFYVYDRCTGTTLLVMGIVTGTHHDHEVHHEIIVDAKTGHSHTETHTHDYYWVEFDTDNGAHERMDVGYWKFSNYRQSQRVVINYTVGGVSKSKYLVNLKPYEGAER
jgi:hypothetical protein